MDIGASIKRERKRLGLTLEELAGNIGFANYQTLGSIEKGERKVRVSELSRIARALGLTASYFLDEPRLREEKIRWRKCSDDKQCKKYENRLQTLCSNYEKLADLIGYRYRKFIPPLKEMLQRDRYPDDYRFADALAEEWRRDLGLGRYPGNNLVDSLTQEKNILIFCLDMGSVGSAGALVGNFGAAILLNRNDRPWRRTFDIAHELFHLITWNVYAQEKTYDNSEREKSRVESYADAFAAALLLPKETLLEEIGKRNSRVNMIDIIDMSTRFRISIQSLTWRLQNLNLVDKKYMEKIREHPDLSDLNKLMREDEPDLRELPEIYVTQALRTFVAGRISKLKLADYLDVRYADLRAFLGRYSYPGVEELSIEHIPA